MVPSRLSKSEVFAFASFQLFRSLVYAGSGRTSRDRFSHGVACIVSNHKFVCDDGYNTSLENFKIRSVLTSVWAFDEPVRASTTCQSSNCRPRYLTSHFAIIRTVILYMRFSVYGRDRVRIGVDQM